jgi:hypothetical protein
VSDLEGIRSVAKKYSLSGKPIWDTESSWGIDAHLTDPDAQANFLARSYILHISQGVQRFYWYAWDGSDGGTTSPDKSWGTLWDVTNGNRPAGQAYGIVRSWLLKAKLPLRCTEDNSVWRCRLSDSSLIIWNSSIQQDYEADPPFTRYSDLAGQSRSLPADHHVSIGPSPILLETH